MKVVILAGGFGTRISEESHLKPKPMIEIGEKPILWHIMKEYSAYGINEFIICAGYKQHMIKEWFADYFIHTSDITFDFTKGNEMIIHNKHAEPWKVTVVDTGLNTQTGGRIKRVKDFVGDDTFMVTYGDAVGDINIDELLAFHRAHGKIGTMSMYNFGQTKGIVDVGNNGIINAFREKSDFDGDLINIGYLWYLYILIGIYLILIPLKRFIDNSSNREICIFTAILIIGNFVIPTINIAFGTKIENYMLFTQYVTYVLLGYIIGGLHAEDNGREKKAIDIITNRGGDTARIVAVCLCNKNYYTVCCCYEMRRGLCIDSGR